MSSYGVGEPGARAVVAIVYRPVGGEYRELRLHLPESKAVPLFDILAEPERFVVAEIRLVREGDGWRMTETARPEARA